MHEGGAQIVVAMQVCRMGVTVLMGVAVMMRMIVVVRMRVVVRVMMVRVSTMCVVMIVLVARKTSKTTQTVRERSRCGSNENSAGVKSASILCMNSYPAWIRTMNNASKGRCVTVTPRGKKNS